MTKQTALPKPPNRSIVRRVVFTPQEAQQLDHAAYNLNMNFSQYVRSVLFAAAAKEEAK